MNSGESIHKGTEQKKWRQKAPKMLHAAWPPPDNAWSRKQISLVLVSEEHKRCFTKTHVSLPEDFVGVTVQRTIITTPQDHRKRRTGLSQEGQRE
jgi:hypothetical protein